MKSGDLVRVKTKHRNFSHPRPVGLILEEESWPEIFKKNSAVDKRFRVMFSEIPAHLVLEESRLEVVDEAG